MPKKSLKDYTPNELNYKEIVDIYNRNKNTRNRIYEDSINISFKANNYELGENNLAYYRSHGPDSEKEEEDFERLKVEEKYYQELNKRCQAYLNEFENFYKTYVKAKELQGQACEMDLAAKKAKEINQAAKESKVENPLNFETKEIEGLHEAVIEFRMASNALYPPLRDFREYAKKEVLQKQMDEAMDAFHKKKDLQHQEEEKERKQREAERKEREEVENIKRRIREEEKRVAREKAEKEAEEKRKVEEAKAKEEAEKQKAIDDKKKEAERLKYIKERVDEDKLSLHDRDVVNEYVKKLNIDEKLNDPTKYHFKALDKDLTLKEAFNAVKQGYLADLGYHSEYSKTLLRNYQLGHLTEGFDDSISDFKNDFVKSKEIIDKENPDKKFTQNQYKPLKNRKDGFLEAKTYAKDLYENAISNSSTSQNAFSGLISYTNQFAQMHHSTKEPGFLSRLFNTDYNKAYNTQKETLESLKQTLGKLNINDEFINQITDKETCSEQINKQDLVDVYNDVYKNNDTIKDNSEENLQLAEAKAMTAIVYDAYFGKEPTESLNDYLEKYNDIVEKYDENVKENGNIFNEKDQEYVDDMKGKLSRIPFEVTECKNEEQSLEEDEFDDEESYELENESEMDDSNEKEPEMSEMQ